MTNAIAKKEYDKIKNDCTYTVVSFQDKRRALTYRNLTVTDVVKEVMRNQIIGREAIIIKNLPDDEISYDRRDYDKYLKAYNQED